MITHPDARRFDIRSLLLVGMCLISVAPASHALDVCPIPVVDDSAVHIASAADVEATRQQLYEYIWGQPTLPTDDDVTVVPDVASPIGCNVNLARVDAFQLDMPTANGTIIDGRAWHFVPQANRRNRLVIVHNGHMAPDMCQDTFADGEDALHFFAPRYYMGLQMTINALVADGYDVLAVLMPLYTADQCLTHGHGWLFAPEQAPASGSGMRYFLDTTLHSLNYLLAHDSYTDVSMTGLSGGGWTTTIYAALDPRIRLSVPVAGSLPLYLRNATLVTALGRMYYDGRRPDDPTQSPCDELGDLEQHEDDMYSIAGYLDLYLLGGYGPGREQIQVLNRRDSCCFGQAEHADPSAWDSDLRNYEGKVRRALHGLGGGGSFTLDTDEAATIHQISRDAAHNVLLAALDGAHARFGAASPASVVKRGTNGNLWYYATSGWQDLGFPVVGAPFVLENAVHSIDVLIRNETDQPQLVYYDNGQWTAVPLITDNGSGVVVPGGRVVTNPIGISLAPGQLDALAQAPRDNDEPGTDFYHWHVTAGGQTLTFAGPATHAVGRPAVTADEVGRLDASYRSGDLTYVDPAPVPPDVTSCVEQPRALYGLLRDGGGAWEAPQRISGMDGRLRGFPSARRYDGLDRVYYTDLAGALWETASSVGVPPWLETSLSQGSGLELAGSPAQPIADASSLGVYVRTSDNQLAQFRYDGATWTSSTLSLDSADSIVDSPSAVEDGVLWTALDDQIRFYDGGGIEVFDVVFRDGFD
ncbi:MAG: hypothetical protein WB784_04670 [Rhodanobacteraceae bacterium]